MYNIEATLRRLKISDAIWCAISGVSTARWSKILRGTAVVNGAESLRLQNLVTEIDQLARDAQPYQMPTRDAVAIKKLLADRRAGIEWRTGIEVREQDEVTAQ